MRGIKYLLSRVKAKTLPLSGEARERKKERKRVRERERERETKQGNTTQLHVIFVATYALHCAMCIHAHIQDSKTNTLSLLPSFCLLYTSDAADEN